MPSEMREALLHARRLTHDDTRRESCPTCGRPVAPDLCPSCGLHPIRVARSGLCLSCHLEHLRELYAERLAQRELDALRQRTHREHGGRPGGP